MNLNKIFEELGYELQDRQEEHIELWKQWYQGDVKDFHNYKTYMGTIGSKDMRRHSLGMAKLASELWADSIYNPETHILIGSESKQSWLDKLLGRVDFTNRFNNLVELYFALGTGATVQWSTKDNEPMLDFVTVEQIYPFKFKGGDVVSCSFVTKVVVDSEELIYINAHIQNKDETYTIRNHYIRVKDDDTFEEVIVEDVETEYQSKVKLFQIYKPAIANNINIGNPMGISIYANAIDEMKIIDTSLDAFNTEIRNGKMKVYLREGALDSNINGNKLEMVSKNEDIFYVLPGDQTNEDGSLITVQAPSLRVGDFINGLNQSLNLFGRKVAFGDNYFTNDNGTIYTNTSQVISTNSKFFKTRQKHASIVEQNIISMIRALHYLEFGTELVEDIDVQFDDSIIHDKDLEFKNNILMLNLGMLSKVQFMMKHGDMTRENAEAHFQELYEDENIIQEEDIEASEEL